MDPELTNEVIQRAWDISPTTIYGFLIGVLVIANTVQWVQNARLNAKLMKLFQSNLGALKDLTEKLKQDDAVLKNNHDHIKGELKEIKQWVQGRK